MMTETKMIDALSKNKTRFIITGDLHWTGKNPKARTDDYQKALVNKINAIFDLAEKCNCEGIIIPGDIFNSPNVSYSVLSNFSSLISLRSKNLKIPVYSIAGNHDLYSGNLNSINRTPLGLLKNIDLIKFIHGYCTWQKEKIIIQGKSFDSGVTDKHIDYYLFEDAPIKDKTNDYTKIIISHGMLLKKSPGYDLRHTLIEEVANHYRAPDILINGHEHQGFGIEKVNNTLFINPGSIGRIKATEENIDRIPQVALLTIPGKGKPETELFDIDCAKPGEEVLSREHIEEQQRKKEMTEEFLGLLEEGGENNYLELEDIMSNIAEREELPENVVQEAMKRVGKVREGMNDD